MSETSILEMPFILMPITGVVGFYAVAGGLLAGYVFYRNATVDSSSRKRPGQESEVMSTSSPAFFALVGTVLAALVGYTMLVAMVDGALMEQEYKLFDPHAILGVREKAGKDAVTKAFKELAKLHHPDAGGTIKGYETLLQAYQSLTEEDAILNYQQFGHPNGPLDTPLFKFALPSWLLFLEPGKNPLVMLIVYIILSGVFALACWSLSTPKKSEVSSDSLETQTVAFNDITFMAKWLSPSATIEQILYTVASTPENRMRSLKDFQKVQEMKEERIAEEEKQKKTGTSAKKASQLSFDNFDDEGWDEDDEEEDELKKTAALAAQKAEEEKQKEMEQLKKATGQVKMLMEGIDHGVIGQKWVEETLEKKGVWPPEGLDFIGKVDLEGKQVEPLEHPGLRRNICMTTGRLNSRMLNTHPELLEAGTKKLLDQTYFRAAMEYRQRVGILLEACLRMAIVLHSYDLAKTIVEAVSIFKIGCPKDSKEWFEGVIMREYGTLPRMKVLGQTVETPDETEVATGDQSFLELQVERLHAEQFTRKKIEMFKKQGIPPQVAFQTFREAWWFLLKAERLDGDGAPVKIRFDHPYLDKVEKADIEKFQNVDSKDSLLTAVPMIVQNITQKAGKLRIPFIAPSVPGKYRFHVEIKSQEFLGADCTAFVDATVVDAKTVTRVKKQPAEEPDENKKEK